MNRSIHYPIGIETERLLIRSPSLDDVADVNAAIHETWDELHCWMSWAVTKPTLMETREIRERQIRAQMQGLDYSVLAFERATGKFAVAIGLHPVESEARTYSVGYWRRACFAGQGLVTEATRAVMEFAFQTLGAKRLILRCRPDNLPSRAVAERCGFVYVGEEPDDDAGDRTWFTFQNLGSSPIHIGS